MKLYDFNISPEQQEVPNDYQVRQESIAEKINQRKSIWIKNELYFEEYNLVSYLNSIAANSELVFIDCKMPLEKDLENFSDFILNHIRLNLNEIQLPFELKTKLSEIFLRLISTIPLSHLIKADIKNEFISQLKECKVFFYLYLPNFEKYITMIPKDDISFLSKLIRDDDNISLIISSVYFSIYERNQFLYNHFGAPLIFENAKKHDIKATLDEMRIPGSFMDTYRLNFGQSKVFLNYFKYDFERFKMSENYTNIDSALFNYISKEYYKMKLTKEQFREFQQYLKTIYITDEELAVFVRHSLNKNINEFAGSNNLNTKTFQLLNWAEAKGRIIELIEAFANENPNNKGVQDLCKSIKEHNTEDSEQFYRQKYANYTKNEVEAELKEVQREIAELKNSNYENAQNTNTVVCFLSANPIGSYPIDPEGQLTQIQNKGFKVNPQMKTKYNKIGELIKNSNYIHVTVHGAKNMLYFEYDDTGKEAQVEAQYFIHQIREAQMDIKELIVLVACQSAKFAEQLVKAKVCKAAIGTTIDISPRAAVEFTKIFYEKLKLKKEPEKAFKSTCIELNNDPYREEYDHKEERYDYYEVFKLYIQQ